MYSDTEIRYAAGLFCEGMSEHSIASALPGRSDEDVRAMIERAMQGGLIRYEPVLAIDKVDADLSDFLLNTTLTEALAAALCDTIPMRQVPLSITPSPPRMFSDYLPAPPNHEHEQYRSYLAAESESLRMVGRRAAHAITRTLLDGQAHCIGLNYGASVYETVRAIVPFAGRSLPPQTVVSLFGDLGFFDPQSALPLIKQNEPLACNELVGMLTAKIGPSARPEFLNVPVFIPEEFSQSPETFTGIRRFLTSHSSYKRIFGSPLGEHDLRDGSGLIARMDTIITGFGSADNYTVLQRFLPTWLSADENRIVKEHCSDRDKGIAGDLGGHFITQHQAHTDDGALDEFLARINLRLIAAKPGDFADVAARRAQNQTIGAGVVGVAAGARKARILHALLTAKEVHISQLFIDTHCALALLHLLSRDRYRAFIKSKAFTAMHSSDKWSDGTQGLIPAYES